MPVKPKLFEPLTDNDLMTQVKKGDLSKMGLLYERYHKELFGYFYRMTNNPAKSEDLVQNVFYRLLKYKDSFDTGKQFRHWVYTVSKNVFNDQFKKRNPLAYSMEIEKTDVEEDSKNQEQRIVAGERKEMLREAMGRLSEDQREAIVLSKFNGMKYHEIAAISGCTESAIKARIRRGLMELRNMIGD